VNSFELYTTYKLSHKCETIYRHHHSKESAMSTLSNPVGWFEIHVADMNRARRFYEAVFGRTLSQLPSGDPEMEMWMFSGDPQGSGASGALVKHPMKTPSTEGALVYFSCADCAEQAALAQQHGGQVFKAKFSIGPNGFIAIVGDSEGNAIGLHSFA
jgi:predicted enzyme related to lactoylglutathione lyase